MEKKIFLPNDEQTAKLIENAWNDFLGKARVAGLDFDNETINCMFKELFVAGYAYGSSDMLALIRDQLNADYMINRMMGD